MIEKVYYRRDISKLQKFKASDFAYKPEFLIFDVDDSLIAIEFKNIHPHSICKVNEYIEEFAIFYDRLDKVLEANIYGGEVDIVYTVEPEIKHYKYSKQMLADAMAKNRWLTFEYDDAEKKLKKITAKLNHEDFWKAEQYISTFLCIDWKYNYLVGEEKMKKLEALLIT